MNQEVKETLLN